MKNRVLSLIMAIVLLGSMFAFAPQAFADDVLTSSDGWKYTVTTVDGKSVATVKGITKSVTALKIPSAINGYTVTKIGEYSFQGDTSATSLTIPDSVTEIGDCAFRDCSKITSITIGNNVKTLGMYAFSGTAITKIVFPNSITAMGEAILSGCTSLKNITLSKNITGIPIYFCNNTAIEQIVIPEGVESIGGSAFYDCKSLVTVYAPTTLKRIYASAFDGATNLKNIKLPEGLTDISQQALRNCKNLEIITLPSTLKYLESEAFLNCTALKNIIAKCSSVFMYSYALGYNSSHNLISGVTIYCGSGSSIENYAVENGIAHAGLGSAPEDPSQDLIPPVEKTSIASATVSGIKAKTYNGKALTQTPVVKVGSVTLKSGTDYSVTYKNNVNAGTATGTITGKGDYTGTKTFKFTINKAANKMKFKTKAVTVKYSKVKSAAQKLAISKVIAFTDKGQGKKTYSKAKGNKSITVAKDGKITVKKGLKKGSYKVKIKVKAAGNANYKALTKTVTVTINVK